MGNRACTGVLCYDIDPERSVQEEATNDVAVIYSKNLPWRFKRALSNSHPADDSIVVPPNNKRRPLPRGGEGKQAKSSSIPFDRENSNSRRKNADKQQQTKSYSDISAGTNDNAANSSATNPMSTGPLFSPYHHCRTMSSETCGREARTEVNLSRRSSTTTCEREGMYDDILFHRSQTNSDERS
jgi:hypothetical protein